MGRRYSIDGTRNVASAAPTILHAESATTIRPVVYDLIVGSSAASPSDAAYTWLIQRYDTADGTNTPVTPVPLENEDPAATTGAGEAHSAEPTYVLNEILLVIPANKRSTQRWVAAPGGELRLPAVANEGVGLQVIHASDTGEVKACIHFEE